MSVTTLVLLVTLSAMSALAARLWMLLRRERANGQYLRQKLQAQGRERDQYVASLQALLLENLRNSLRLTAIVSALWTQLKGQHGRVLKLKQKYKDTKSDGARLAVWITEYRLEIDELRALVTRVLARWNSERRRRARESLIQELIAAIMHFVGLPDRPT